MARQHTQTRYQTIYHGWYVVGVAFLVALFAWGIGFYGPGIYLVALQDRYGWPAATIASAITVYYLIGAVLIAKADAVFARIGNRLTVLLAVAVMALSAVLLSLTTEPWHVYAAFIVMAFGWAGMSGAAVNILVAPWFQARRGYAISLALNGASAGGVVIVPALVLGLDTVGFRPTLWLAASAMALVLVPAVLATIRPPRAGELHSADRTANDAEVQHSSADPPSTAATLQTLDLFGHVRFLTIAVPFALGLIAQVGFLTHQVPFLAPRIGAEAAGWLVSLTTLTAIVARIGTGFFVDRIERRLTACANFLVQVAGMAVLVLFQTEAALYIGCLLFGVGLGNMISLPGILVQRDFPPRDFAKVISLVLAICQVSLSFGPALLGYLKDWSGGYEEALIACMLLQLGGAVIVLVPLLVPEGKKRS